MTTIRRFCCNDLLRFASVNLDHLTETVTFLSLSCFPFFAFSSMKEMEKKMLLLLLLFLLLLLLIFFFIDGIMLITVQYVLLHDLFGKVARLFSCRRRPWKPNYGLQ